MPQTVELHTAFFFICPECGRDNFERGVTLEPEQVAGMVSEDRREWAEEYEGHWLMKPARVTCKACGATFDIEET